LNEIENADDVAIIGAPGIESVFLYERRWHLTLLFENGTAVSNGTSSDWGYVCVWPLTLFKLGMM
jgi:hypothetical protein